jgi:sugar phosphate isomerase/epimerase
VSRTIQTGFAALSSEDITDAFRTVEDSTFDFVEVQMDHWDRQWLQKNGNNLQEFADEAAADVLIHLPFGKENESVAASDSAIRTESIEWYQSCIETAASVGATKGVLHVESNDSSDHLTDENRQAELIETLQELNRFARDQGLTICVENLPDRYPDLDDLKTLAKQTDLVFTIDTGHAKVNGYSDKEIAQFVEEYSNRVSHFHLNDTRKPADEHLPFGAGNIDFDQIFASLPSSWKGTLTAEIQTFDYDYIKFSGEMLSETLNRCS